MMINIQKQNIKSVLLLDDIIWGSFSSYNTYIINIPKEMKRINELIKAIEESDLSAENKIILIDKLNKQEPDLKGVVELLISFCNLSRGILDLFNM